MSSLVVAFPKLEMTQKIKKVLGQSGYTVTAACTSGAQILSNIDGSDCGIIVCGYQFRDMLYTEVLEYLPEGFHMILIASPSAEIHGTPPALHVLRVPFQIHSLLAEVNDLENEILRYMKRMRKKQRPRTAEEQQLIELAKSLLIERRGMTEEEAHRYIQKRSMETGRTLIDTSERIIKAAEKNK